MVEGGALEGAEMEVEEGDLEGVEDAPQSGNREEGEGSLDREGREVERRLLEGVGPHGEEGEGLLDEGEWGMWKWGEKWIGWRAWQVHLDPLPT